tara:strand:- start:385 stop:612 length:228 start_codon:yes stop_codon:yes gene_type:complete
MASRTRNKKWKVYRELTEKEKDAILHWITNLNRPIKDATKHFNLSLGTINKIYETRYSCENKKEIINQNEKRKLL